MVDDQRVRGFQSHGGAIADIEVHQGLPAFDDRRISGEFVSELKHGIFGDRVEVVIAVDVITQPFHDDVEKGTQCNTARHPRRAGRQPHR